MGGPTFTTDPGCPGDPGAPRDPFCPGAPSVPFHPGLPFLKLMTNIRLHVAVNSYFSPRNTTFSL